jgi:hypothetical protein
MASAAQIRANCENAKRSTGPRTEAGKQATKFNALKHGLAAESLVIRGESPAELDALRAQLRADHCPVGETESMLVEEIAQCWWRLQRARAQEKRSITVSMERLQPYNPDDLAHVIRYIAHAERGWHRAITQLRTVQNDRRKRETSGPAANPASQTTEEDKVMAVGSVPQNAPEPAEAAPEQPEIGSDSRISQVQDSKEFKQFRGDRFRRAMMEKLEVDIRNVEEELRREGK